MKKKLLGLAMLATIALASCGTKEETMVSNPTSTTADTIQTSSSTIATTTAVITPSASDALEDKQEITAPFAITTEDGAFSNDGSVYTITSGGSYTLSGKLAGSIVITTDGEVELVLNNVSITCDTNSPIYSITAEEIKIKSLENTYNEIIDSRTMKTEDDEAMGNGAIYTKCDVKLTGKGSLYVSGSYNNGIHTTKDLSVKNTKLRVEAVNHALKGNDSVTVESGNLILISKAGDGIKTEDTDISSKGNQRGTITLKGTIDIYSCCDGVDAAYDAVIEEGCSLNITTSKYSSYSDESLVETDSSTASTNTQQTRGGWPGFGGGGGFGFSEGNSNKSSYSAKGIKAHNLITVNGGIINIKAYDDGFHASNEATLDNGNAALGNVVIAGGTIVVDSADDGIHADNELTIEGGSITITTSYEGIEGNQIIINDGSVSIYSTDDGVNASSGSKTPLVQVNGGYLDVTVGSGDTDGIDSNGNYVQTGGFVITKCPVNDTSGNMAALDIDGNCSITGGTFISCGPYAHLPDEYSQNYILFGSSSSTGNKGFGRPGGGMSSSISFTKGEYSITGTSISFTLSTTYNGLWISSSELTTGSDYTLEGPVSYSWTQSSGKTTIS